MAAPQQSTVPATDAESLESITTAMPITNEEQSCSAPTFTTIPTEVRVRILQEVVTFLCPLRFIKRKSARKLKIRGLRRPNISILLCNKQVYDEAFPEFFSLNTFTFDPMDKWSTLPPYAFARIQHLRIKPTITALLAHLDGKREGYLQLRYFRRVKLLTLSCSNDAAEYLDYVLYLPCWDLDDITIKTVHPITQSFRGVYKIAVAKVVVEGVEQKYLVDKIKTYLCDTS